MIKINYECDHCQHFNQFNIIKTQPLECNQCKNNFGTIDLDWDYNNTFDSNEKRYWCEVCQSYNCHVEYYPDEYDVYIMNIPSGSGILAELLFS